MRPYDVSECVHHIPQSMSFLEDFHSGLIQNFHSFMTKFVLQ